MSSDRFLGSDILTLELLAGTGPGANGSGVYPMYVEVSGCGGAQRGSQRDRFGEDIGDRFVAEVRKEKK